MGAGQCKSPSPASGTNAGHRGPVAARPRRRRCGPPAIQHATAERTRRPCGLTPLHGLGKARGGVGWGWGRHAGGGGTKRDTLPPVSLLTPPIQPSSPSLGLSAVCLCLSQSLPCCFCLSAYFLPSFSVFLELQDCLPRLSLRVSLRISESLHLCKSVSSSPLPFPLRPRPFLLPFVLSSTLLAGYLVRSRDQTLPVGACGRPEPPQRAHTQSTVPAQLRACFSTPPPTHTHTHTQPLQLLL